jgi:hypothetical protein
VNSLRISKKTQLRIGKAIGNGWGIVKPIPPGNPKTQRGSVWIQGPGDWNEWWVEKAMVPHWLEKCLDQAKVPK